MVIRRLFENDVPSMALLLKEGFPVSLWSASDLHQFMVLETCQAWGSFDDMETLRGFLLVQGALDESEILLIVVDPFFRRQGIGHSLLKKATTFLKDQGRTSLFLEVSVENEAAVNFYTGEGFVKVGNRKDYYSHKHNKSAHILVKRI